MKSSVFVQLLQDITELYVLSLNIVVTPNLRSEKLQAGIALAATWERLVSSL